MIMSSVQPQVPCPAATASDRELLQAFASQHSEQAFRLLVERHSGLVSGACRRILRNHAATEDASQAVFLILAGRAPALLWTLGAADSLAPWLYRVAVNAALQSRRGEQSRRQVEREAVVRQSAVAQSAPGEQELVELLDEEVSQLPRRYQEPVVLCHLQGRTQIEAARALAVSHSTIRRRLDEALDLLRQRLSRRGVTVSGVVLASLLWKAGPVSAAPLVGSLQSLSEAAVLNCGVKASQLHAAGLVSSGSVQIGRKVLHMWYMTKLKLLAGSAVVASTLVLGGGLAFRSPATAGEAEREAEPVPAAIADATKPADPPPATDVPPAETQSVKAARSPAKAGNSPRNKRPGAGRNLTGSGMGRAGSADIPPTARSGGQAVSGGNASASSGGFASGTSGGTSGGTTGGGQSGGGLSGSGGRSISSSASTANGVFTGKITVDGVETIYHDRGEYEEALAELQQSGGGLSGGFGNGLPSAEQLLGNLPPGFGAFPGGGGFAGGTSSGGASSGGSASSGGTSGGTSGGGSISTSSSMNNGQFSGKITVDGVEHVYDDQKEYEAALDELRQAGRLGAAGGGQLLPGAPGGQPWGAAPGARGQAGAKSGKSARAAERPRQKPARIDIEL